MKKVTLCFCVRDSQVLLAMKKRGFGAGKWNGYGGKVKEGESVREATTRELKEESSLVANPADLKQVALTHFYFAEQHVFDCDVFLLHDWTGEPVETDEMKPKWWDISNLPFGEMWVADDKWLPFIFAGEKIEAHIYFNAGGSECSMFTYKPVEFD